MQKQNCTALNHQMKSNDAKKDEKEIQKNIYLYAELLTFLNHTQQKMHTVS